MIRKTTTFAELLAACHYIQLVGDTLPVEAAAWLEARLAEKGIQLSVRENIDNTEDKKKTLIELLRQAATEPIRNEDIPLVIESCGCRWLGLWVLPCLEHIQLFSEK